MKKLIVILALIVQGCFPSESEKKTAGKDSQQSSYNHIMLNVVVDRSTSYVRSYAFPEPNLFKPLCDKISQTASLDFRFGCIFSNSNMQFDRYYSPFVKKSNEEENENPWLQESKPKADVTIQTDWNDFAERIRNKISLPPSKSSDISSAISHAIISLTEKQHKNKSDNTVTSRKILILCTDFQDSYRKNMPTIPAGIEVICIGVLPDVSVEHILHCKISRFENLDAAIEYLLSTF